MAPLLLTSVVVYGVGVRFRPGSGSKDWTGSFRSSSSTISGSVTAHPVCCPRRVHNCDTDLWLEMLPPAIRPCSLTPNIPPPHHPWGDLQGLNVLNLSAGALKLLGLSSFPDKEKR